MSKSRPDSKRRSGRVRTQSSSAFTVNKPKKARLSNLSEDDIFKLNNKNLIREWDKDDGKYIDLYSKSFDYNDINTYVPNFNEDHLKAVKKLSPLSKTAIFNYTYDAGLFNDSLRTNTPMPSENSYITFPHEKYVTFTKLELKRLEQALSRSFKHELNSGIIVARGSSLYSGAIPKVGDITVNKAYTSTAYGNRDWSSSDAIIGLPIRYIIRVPKGSKILNASGLDQDGFKLSAISRSENEIILRKNAVFRTTKVETVGKKTYIYQDFLGYGSPKKLSRRKLKG